MTNVAQIEAYLRNDLKVLISGLHGTGKTTMIKQACENLGYTLKYYNCSTLDAFTDLIGLPVPNHETHTTDYYRPRAIDEAEVVFMDEVNRADPRTLNAIFELVQFGTINGEKLPKLRCVIAAMNPPGGEYNVDDLDPALIDRFDLYLEQTPDYDFRYFADRFGKDVAQAACTWGREQYQAYLSASKKTNNTAVYISPRRLEIVVNAYSKIRQPSTVKASLPVGATGAPELVRRLEAAFSAAASSTPVQNVAGDFGYLLTLNPAQIRSRKNLDVIKKAFENNDKNAPGRAQFLSSLALALNKSTGAVRIAEDFGFALDEFTPAQMETMTGDWIHNKKRELYEARARLTP